MSNSETRAGFVALVGRPNVGKSTLLNYLLGQKISITSRKPQTTRHRILGIKTVADVQFIYLDTPGMHVKETKRINHYMNRAAMSVLHDVDVIVWVVDALDINEEDRWILKKLEQAGKPVILALNKIDKIKQRENLLPIIENFSKQFKFLDIIPISAKLGQQVGALEEKIKACLPANPHFYDPEQITDRSDRFIASEIVREKLMRLLGQEIPYSLTVTIDAFAEDKDIVRISAVIWVEKAGQKAIVIGKKGEKLKEVGLRARADMETYFEKQVYLQLWVKIKTGWSDDERSLAQFGYRDE